MSKRDNREITTELEGLVKSGGRLLDSIEARGRRISRLSTGAVHAVIGICSGYLLAYGASLQWDINMMLVGTLSGGILAGVGVLASRPRFGRGGDGPTYEVSYDRAVQLAEYLAEHQQVLSNASRDGINREIAQLLKSDPTPPLALPAPDALDRPRLPGA